MVTYVYNTMIDPVTITILVTTIVASFAQALQMYLDYKKAQAQGHDIYQKTFVSSCCSTNTN